MTILPCPFCGADASIEEIQGSCGQILFSVGCDSFSEMTCMGYQSFTNFNTRGEAVAAWNRRHVVLDAKPLSQLAERYLEPGFGVSEKTLK